LTPVLLNVLSNPRIALIGLGSNLGDSVAIVRQAMERLRALSSGEILCSSLWHSNPVDCPPGSPAFVNAAVALTVPEGETPESLLTKLQGIEREFGRQPKRVENEPRLLDLDLISFGREQRRSQRLILPHPRAHLRRFVLAPLAEIAPDYRLPGLESAIQDLLTTAPEDPALVMIK